MKMLLFFPLFWISSTAFAFNNLSAEEEKEVLARLQRFYRASPTDKSVMSEPIPKYNLTKQSWVSPPHPNKNQTLKELAGFKARRSYHKRYCETVLKRRFPALYESTCLGGSWATSEKNDQLKSLTESWIAEEDLTFDMNQLPIQGDTAKLVWSDDYWKTRWGQTSYRYSTGIEYPNYSAAIIAYAQPTEWLALQGQFPDEMSKTILSWSPSEKYDLTVGDEAFTLTTQQKELGKEFIGDDGDVADWMGICHGWAAASIAIPRPTKSVSVVGPSGLPMTWYPADVRAMISLAWANGEYKTNFIGGRCNVEEVATFPNGRVKQQKCFDTNPSTLHLALANMIGKFKLSFAFDATFDAEVWNQPMAGYAIQYFNPTNPTLLSNDWRTVAVDYNEAFKAVDRFQNPLTRGIRKQGKYDDSRVKKIVGVVTTITYLEEYGPPAPFTPTVDAESYEHVTYTYDLELEEQDGVWIPTGGEWHTNLHPDFLWVAVQNSLAQSAYDTIPVDYVAGASASDHTTAIATAASKKGYPLCKVIKEVVKQSVGDDVYPCPVK